ncbi:TcfC E-set like domain-containing protein [Erwinia sp.]|uniref:TcfC E-set like domain-containing protein n=1 Tax=Erwinia citreus TaxID=558 RepID=UPI0028967390|nr:TcfC E-set like domain-containing protein [Erwinia sp.]
MKHSLLWLAMLPAMAPAADMTLAASMRGLPDDFKNYFYNAEVIVRVDLNDRPLFDAAMLLKENGDVQLNRIIDNASEFNQEVQERWVSVLRKGITTGKCSTRCPFGLMAAQYRLDSSVLKIYTAKYETEQTKGAFIELPNNLPGGFIMYNDFSATSTSSSTQSWGINSAITSSLAGWTQKASFQSSGNNGRYSYNNTNLYDLYTQKELAGSFMRFGLFSPDADQGNVQSTGFGFDSVVGAMWGTSDALRENSDSVSAWPVYITGRNQSIAEVYRDGRLIHTQQLQAGVQPLDTRRLPGGIYDITVRIIENGQTVDTQTAQIYKPQGWSDPERRWRMNLWSGQRRLVGSGTARYQQDMPFAVGGSLDVLAHPRAVLGLSGQATEKEHQLRTRANITLSPKDTLFAEYSFGNDDYRANRSADIRYFRQILPGSSGNVFWRSTTTDIYGHRTTSRQSGDTWGTSLSLRLPWSSFLILNGQYMDTAWRKGVGADAAVNTRLKLIERDVNIRVSAYERPGFNNDSRDRGVTLGISFSLAPSQRHLVSAELGMNESESYSSMNYQWQAEQNNSIRWLGTGVSHSASNTVLSGNGAVDTRYLSSDFYAQHSIRDGNNTAGINLSQVLLFGGGHLASTNGSNNRSLSSAVIVDVESEDKNIGIVASGKMAETTLQPGRNIVSAESWKKDTLQFSAKGGSSVQIVPERQNLQMNRGSVQYIRVKAVKTVTLVAMLQDESGTMLKNRAVTSDVANGVINAEGVLTLDMSTHNGKLTVQAENHQATLSCAIPPVQDATQRVRFIDAIHCRTAGDK